MPNLQSRILWFRSTKHNSGTTLSISGHSWSRIFKSMRKKKEEGAENKTKGLTNKITSELLILLRLTVLKAVAVFHYHPLKIYRANTSTSTSRPLSSPKHLSFLQREPASGCLFTEYLNGPDTFAGSFGQNDRSVSKDLVYCTEPRPTCQGTEF